MQNYMRVCMCVCMCSEMDKKGDLIIIKELSFLIKQLSPTRW